ncbi:MAG: COX aromatic rich motif-containing protein [Parachlamydiales bacterium]|nr:COX aromatic rich motif-containing protein [Candidatus Acheromyda pituitae]
MKKFKVIAVIIAISAAAAAIYCVLRNDLTLLTHPKGTIAHSELNLMKTNILLMLAVIVPTFLWLFIILWRSRAKSSKAKSEAHDPYATFKEVMMWIVPSIVVAVMSVITWRATHQLDPYRPLESEIQPLTIQVVALDWKWLFIYPEQGIATINLVQFPERTPIRFELSADGSPMNSFWIPQLSGQIYSMTGMVTQLHLMADTPGVYTGRAAEINGRGFADMTFVVKSLLEADFDQWIEEVRRSPLQLSELNYNELVKPSENNPITLYSNVEKDLFNKIVMKY